MTDDMTDSADEPANAGAGADATETPATSAAPETPGAPATTPTTAVPEAPVTPAETDAHVAQPNTAKYGAAHVESHPHVRWHTDILVDGHDIYHGFIKDVSMTEANLYLDHNLQNIRLVKLHIHVPPLVVTSHPQVLAVSAKIISTVYDSTEECFRSAILFLQFADRSDLDSLRSRIG